MPVDTPQLIHLLPALLLGLPFAGFLILTGASRRTAGLLAIVLTGLGLILSVALALQLPDQPLMIQGDWAVLSGISFPMTLRVDAMAAMMLVLVHFVALLVEIYSLSYLHDEPKLRRYFGYLQLFIGAMLGIVLAGNLLVMYAFWELVGLASYLLIGFYAERQAASKAAKKAFLMNRVGDIGFLVGIFLTYNYFGTLDFSALALKSEGVILPTALGLCLFMGCVGKSAQFPLLTWLPDAMEGPTPVSALLHAATMVAAGIFLLARIHPLLSPDALVVVALIGTITTIWGGYSALFQTDIKKVLAFSTVSQLGLMVAAMGTGNVSGAMFHLLTHAFFKAGLFLSAGAVIHAVHTQDMRQMGGLRQVLSTTFIGYTICAAALAGLPLFSGFLSKEVILGGAFGWAADQEAKLSYFIPVLLLLSSGLTALYMARQWRLIFFGTYRNGDIPLTRAHEPDWLMRGPVVLLAALSIGIWFSINPLSAHGSWFFGLFPTVEAISFWWLAPVSIGLVILGGWIGFRMVEPNTNSIFVQLSLSYGFLDVGYHYIVINPTRKLASLLNRMDKRIIDGLVNGAGVSTVVLAHLSRVVDRSFVDGLVNGMAWLASQLGRLTRSVQNGQVQSYITAAVVGLLLVLWWIL
ncbi:NADH-quinone oxidoreductase subunit L [Spirosoma sp. KCTC 42546]|uniref:NADH-quinone oxidoreductase subunit 5 family protein n=1 Tax=Spirosoma sp. KCTC 42546 TaxID=2520506 RepID=UPI00115BBE6E|nr:NADH-quinone oxidoreductase subunit L [Spirosoma sp. KCTC 42546]QDK83069.1 NADH-quinone oxidoreductase subunit L [Spirosoma sp. KCTC 42546]